MSKLTPEQVLEIASDTRQYAECAADYSISAVMVGLIRNGQRYAHITGLEPNRSTLKLSDLDRADIRASTESTAILAHRYAVHPSTIRKVRAKPD